MQAYFKARVGAGVVVGVGGLLVLGWCWWWLPKVVMVEAEGDSGGGGGCQIGAGGGRGDSGGGGGCDGGCGGGGTAGSASCGCEEDEVVAVDLMSVVDVVMAGMR